MEHYHSWRELVCWQVLTCIYKFATKSSSEAHPDRGEILLDMCRRKCFRSCSVKVRFVPSASWHLLLHSLPGLLPWFSLVLVTPVTPTQSLLCAHKTTTSFRAASSVLLKTCWHCPLHRASLVGDPNCALIAPSAWMGRPPNGCCHLWLHRHSSSHLKWSRSCWQRAAVASDCYSFANRAYGLLDRH